MVYHCFAKLTSIAVLSSSSGTRFKLSTMMSVTSATGSPEKSKFAKISGATGLNAFPAVSRVSWILSRLLSPLGTTSSGAEG